MISKEGWTISQSEDDYAPDLMAFKKQYISGYASVTGLSRTAPSDLWLNAFPGTSDPRNKVTTPFTASSASFARGMVTLSV
jgi:hypothetical protein